MSGFEKFQRAMIEAAKSHMDSSQERDDNALAKVLNNHIFNLDGPKTITRELTAKDRFFGKTFRQFLEIGKSVETLNDSLFYMGRFPFSGTKITPSRYLRFHVEAWLAEVYILQERLRSYLKALERQHKKNPHFSAIRANCKHLDELISKTLGSVIKARGGHVHENRFSDDDIERLDTLDLLTLGREDDFSNLMSLHRRGENRKVRKIWKDRIGANNKVILELLDMFFDALFPLVFDEDSETLRYPRGCQ